MNPEYFFMAARGNPVREKKGLGGDPEWRLRSVAKNGQFTPVFPLFVFESHDNFELLLFVVYF